MSFFKKTAVAAIAGSLVFGALGVASANAAPITGGFVTQTTAEDPWAAPNAWQYFHIEKINGGAIIKGLNESGAQLARTHSIISIPATDKDGTTIIELTGRAGNGSAFGFSNHMSKVKGIKSWGKLKKISSVVTGLNIHVGGPVKLPDTWGEITEIGENAFIYSDIEKLPTSWGNVEKIAGGAFNGSSFAKQLVLPGDWGKVKEIGRHAFKEAGVASIPASWGMVETIGQGAFESNKLTAVPKDFANVRKIDSFAFEYNQITDFAQSWGKLTELDTRVFANNKIETLPKDFGNLTKFERSAFGVHKNLSSKSSLRFGDTYALPASNLTPKFINDVTAMILYSDKSAEGKQITLCTYDGSNPNTVPSSFLAKVNPAECAEFLKGIKKPEASNTEQPKTDAPNQDAPKGEQPKTDAPKTDAPKQDQPKTDAPKTDAPKQDQPKTDAPKNDQPKQDAPKSDAPKQDQPVVKVPDATGTVRDNEAVILPDGTVTIKGKRVDTVSVFADKDAAIKAQGFERGEDVAVTVAGKTYVVKADENGVVTFIVPKGLAAGEQKFAFAGAKHKANLTVTVVAAPNAKKQDEKKQTVSGKQLADTGADASALLVAAGILTAAGAAGLVVARRRKA